MNALTRGFAVVVRHKRDLCNVEWENMDPCRVSRCAVSLPPSTWTSLFLSSFVWIRGRKGRRLHLWGGKKQGGWALETQGKQCGRKAWVFIWLPKGGRAYPEQLANNWAGAGSGMLAWHINQDSGFQGHGSKMKPSEERLATECTCKWPQPWSTPLLAPLSSRNGHEKGGTVPSSQKIDLDLHMQLLYSPTAVFSIQEESLAN